MSFSACDTVNAMWTAASMVSTIPPHDLTESDIRQLTSAFAVLKDKMLELEYLFTLTSDLKGQQS
jgi:hypothetical protein